MRILQRFAVLAFLLWPLTGFTQTSTPTELAISRSTSQGLIPSTARLLFGLSRNNGASFESSALTTDDIRLIATLVPEAAQVGQAADIFVVAYLNGNYFMRVQSGAFASWNGTIPGLLPFRSQETLSANHPIDFLTGRIPLPGNFLLFVGYKTADGVLMFNPTPLRITISTPPPPTKTIREQATEAFAANISNNIVQNVCIVCHVRNGQADGIALHTFVPASNPAHLSTNFTQFENLLKARGRAYILGKVRGGNGHIGGVVLANGSPDYQNLDAFLQLLEQL